MSERNVTEEWRAVVGHEGRYEVSNLGRVKSVERKVQSGRGWRIVGGVILNPMPGPFGKLRVKLREGVRRFVHQLVLEAFVGPCPKGMEACHYENDSANNRLDNLRWDTRISNVADKRRVGTLPIGSKHPMSKLTEETVSKVLAAYDEARQKRGATKAIAEQFGITWHQAQQICSRTTWKHVITQ